MCVCLYMYSFLIYDFARAVFYLVYPLQVATAKRFLHVLYTGSSRLSALSGGYFEFIALVRESQTLAPLPQDVTYLKSSGTQGK